MLAYYRRQLNIIKNLIKLKNMKCDNKDDKDNKDNIESNNSMLTKSTAQLYDMTDCFHITIECLSGANFNDEGYLVMASVPHLEKLQIIMSVMVFPHKSRQFQFHMGITKHPEALMDGNDVKNLSMSLHSFAASLFNAKFIAIRPLNHMLNILKRNIPTLFEIKDEEEFFGLNTKEMDDFMGIASGDTTYAIPVTPEFIQQKSNPDVTFTVYNMKTKCFDL